MDHPRARVFSWYSPPTIKPPSVSLDVALSLRTLVRAQESPACLRNRARLQAKGHAGQMGHGEHAPAWRPLLPPWHRNGEGWRGRRTKQVSPTVKAQTSGQRQRNEKKNLFLNFLFDFLLASSCLLICQSVCQAGSGSAWVSIAYTHGYAHPLTQTCV